MDNWDLRSLKSVTLDFENKVFEINGVDIKYYTDLDITFHNSEWKVKVGVGAVFKPSGEKKRTPPQDK